MKRKLAYCSVVLGLGGMMLASLSTYTSSAYHLGSSPQPEPQTFNLDANTCLGGTSSMTGTESSDVFPATACSGETLSPGTATSSYTEMILSKGQRLGVRTTYRDSAFGIAPPSNGTTVGGVKEAINIGCDDTTDFFADSSSTIPYGFSGNVPEPFVSRTTAWGPGTGVGGSDESPLSSSVPPFPRLARYRADVDFVTLGTSIPTSLSTPRSYNLVFQSLPWSTGATMTTRTFDVSPGGSGGLPSAQLVLCLDSPATALETLNPAAGVTNPVAPGLYALWTTSLSTPGLQNEQIQQFQYTTSCKRIGGTVVDNDNDCWADGLDTDSALADQDGDGLLDGLEVTWLGGAPCPNGGGSPVNTPDCDGDGRTDLEEMVGPANLLTNPRVADTDGDGIVDAGLNLDCDGNGIPDSVAEVTNAGGGRSRLLFNVRYCKPDGTSTSGSGPCSVVPFATAGCGGRPFGNPGAASEDNCPNAANPDQTTTATADLPNGRFPGTSDVTQPGARFTGDACEADRDNDGVYDVAEAAGFFYDSTGTGSKFCNTDAVGVAIATDPGNRDSDGDGSIDGVECQLGKNPSDATSRPGTTLTTEQQVYFRLKNLTQPNGPLLSDLDDDDTVLNGVSEVKLGLAPNVRDTDRDGCADVVELADVDGNRSANDADRLSVARAVLGIAPFTPPLTSDEKRTADIDGNGVINDVERLNVSRIVLNDALPTILDVPLNCTAARIGYDAN